MSDLSTNKVIQKLEGMLPNRNNIRNYIWDNFDGPFDEQLNVWLLNNIETYGSWKIKYRKDGTLAYKGWIYNKRKNGHWEYFYKNGQPRINCFFRNSTYHGQCTFWNVNGVYEVRHYYKGRLHGELLRYGNEGTLYQKWIFEMGKATAFFGPVELGLTK